MLKQMRERERESKQSEKERKKKMLHSIDKVKNQVATNFGQKKTLKFNFNLFIFSRF